MKIQEQILGKADRSHSFPASDGTLSRAAAAQLESTTSKDIARMRTELHSQQVPRDEQLEALSLSVPQCMAGSQTATVARLACLSSCHAVAQRYHH